jgi:redox-sensitive bicupin YhaK (pirin superfamily)
MNTILHSARSRGAADHGWLKSFHTFSFADYYDPDRMHFGALRVLNDDFIAPGRGFGTHPHQDMEIVTIPLSGALQHRDSTGTSAVIRKGEVQIMSAGTGIRHSEMNASGSEPVTLLQIWVLPEKLGIPPRYEQKEFSRESRKNRWQTVVDPDRREGALWINQRARFSLADLEKGKALAYAPETKDHGGYLFVISGSVTANGQPLEARDGGGFSGPITVQAEESAELVLIEVPLEP